MKEWSHGLKDKTREILCNMPIASFTMRPEGCYLKNIDGRFGFITLNDAMAENYIVHVRDKLEDEKEAYNSIDAIVDAGWAVD